jgi:hypothetical protein
MNEKYKIFHLIELHIATSDSQRINSFKPLNVYNHTCSTKKMENETNIFVTIYVSHLQHYSLAKNVTEYLYV